MKLEEIRAFWKPTHKMKKTDEIRKYIEDKNEEMLMYFALALSVGKEEDLSVLLMATIGNASTKEELYETSKKHFGSYSKTAEYFHTIMDDMPERRKMIIIKAVIDIAEMKKEKNPLDELMELIEEMKKEK
jgi:hypothetical protein